MRSFNNPSPRFESRIGSALRFFLAPRFDVRAVVPTIVMVKAVPPPTFSGPDVEPFQMEWALYGLTGGMVVGSLLSLLCWKLFP